ncbi:MAG: DsbA family oxidoreductase [Gemmatimonadaceae bacterium]
MQITYYTDPLCSWSWAFEPVYRRLRYEFGDRIRWRNRMGGMIPGWSNYSDPLNDVGGPSHMGPQWLEVSRTSGMPIDPYVWHDDPPGSSYPACVAVKAAELQGAELGDRYLRRAREAVMLQRRNIARRDVLLAIAEELAASTDPSVANGGFFDVVKFTGDLDGEAMEAFRQDVHEARYHGIGRFPTLVVTRAGQHGVVTVGYRPYELMREIIAHVAPDVVPERPAPLASEYTRYWRDSGGSMTEDEIQLACG